MNYELAKKLKEAGFPQGEGYGGVICENGYYDDIYQTAQIPFAYVPTLSELIEACGDKFGSLYRWENEQGLWWSAILRGETDFEFTREDRDRFSARTPESAVAKLWLSLNKK